jgi:hypothetical protein
VQVLFVEQALEDTLILLTAVCKLVKYFPYIRSPELTVVALVSVELRLLFISFAARLNSLAEKGATFSLVEAEIVVPPLTAEPTSVRLLI